LGRGVLKRGSIFVHGLFGKGLITASGSGDAGGGTSDGSGSTKLVVTGGVDARRSGTSRLSNGRCLIVGVVELIVHTDLFVLYLVLEILLEMTPQSGKVSRRVDIANRHAQDQKLVL
jgi:hypothetical protein